MQLDSINTSGADSAAHGDDQNNDVSGIVVGLEVDPRKVQRARDLRRHMTDAEKMLWQHLRGHRCAELHFRRQQVISGFIVDFYCHEARLVVEVDGSVHQDQVEYDLERDHVLAGHGLVVLRVSNEAVTSDIAGVLRQITELARRER